MYNTFSCSLLCAEYKTDFSLLGIIWKLNKKQQLLFSLSFSILHHSAELVLFETRLGFLSDTLEQTKWQLYVPLHHFQNNPNIPNYIIVKKYSFQFSFHFLFFPKLFPFFLSSLLKYFTRKFIDILLALSINWTKLLYAILLIKSTLTKMLNNYIWWAITCLTLIGASCASLSTSPEAIATGATKPPTATSSPTPMVKTRIDVWLVRGMPLVSALALFPGPCPSSTTPKTSPGIEPTAHNSF